MSVISGVGTPSVGVGLLTRLLPSTIKTDSTGASSASTVTSSGVQSPSLQISSSASATSDLLDIANKYVKDNSLSSNVEYKSGYPTAGGYVNVKKYNDFILSTAADQMVDQGQKVGLTIDKSQAVQAIRQSNYDVSSATDDNAARTKSLNIDGGVSDFTFLTDSDRDAFTDTLIAEKQSGGDGSATYHAARDLAGQRHDADTAKNNDLYRQQYAPATTSVSVDVPVAKASHYSGNDKTSVNRVDVGRAILSDMVTAGMLSAENIASTATAASSPSKASDPASSSDSTLADESSYSDIKQVDTSDVAPSVKPADPVITDGGAIGSSQV